MKPNEKREGERWFEQAKRDIDDARFSASGERHNLACFLAQQAAEKAIKAYLYAQGAEEVWGHSVVELCNDAREINSEFLDIKKDAAFLDKYYIPTRYPNGLPGGLPSDAFQEIDSKKAIEVAEKILNFIEKLLSEKE